MRCDDQASGPLLHREELVEVLHLLDGFVEVDEQDVLAPDGALDARNEDNASLFRVRGKRAHIQLPVVQRDRQGVIVQRSGTVDQVERAMGDDVVRIVGGVSVEVDFEHGLARQAQTSSAGSGPTVVPAS